MGNKALRKAASEASKADVEITDAMAPHRKDLPIRLLSRFSELGDQPQLRLISGGTALAGLLLGRSRMLRAGLRMLVAHEAATFVKNVVKNRVDRARPRTARNHRQANPRPGKRTAKEQTSFPSGHTAGAVAVAQAFSREFPEHRAAALTAAGIVAVAQIPRCAHYPTDVAAGALVGAATEALVAIPWDAIDRRLGVSDA
jgi:membrane-associated phospholipid phosphatase